MGIGKPGIAFGAEIPDREGVAREVAGILQTGGELQGVCQVELPIGAQARVGISGGSILGEDIAVEVDLLIKEILVAIKVEKGILADCDQNFVARNSVRIAELGEDVLIVRIIVDRGDLAQPLGCGGGSLGAGVAGADVEKLQGAFPKFFVFNHVPIQ